MPALPTPPRAGARKDRPCKEAGACIAGQASAIGAHPHVPPQVRRISCLTPPLPTLRRLPAAVKALAASGLAVGISAAGRIGSCNPPEGNYKHFYDAAGNGSWLGVVTGKRRACCALRTPWRRHTSRPPSTRCCRPATPATPASSSFHGCAHDMMHTLRLRLSNPRPDPPAGAAHAQFADAGCVVNAAADLLCGRGRGVSRPSVAVLTATPMLAWLWEELEGQVRVPAPSRAVAGLLAAGVGRVVGLGLG